MRNILKCCHRSRAAKALSESNANVVDGKLILSFPGAITPVVWQMDLANAKSSALEVQEEGAQEGEAPQFLLVLKTPKGESVKIAFFNTKEQAVEGLMAASTALRTAHGQISLHSSAVVADHHTRSAVPSGAYAPHKAKKKWCGKLFLFILAIVALLILVILLSPQPTSGVSNSKAASQALSNEEISGIPMSADDYLSR